MEIMIVIIVIAILASIAGPMIGNITDQGRSSATKTKLDTLKQALIKYNSDIGRFPSMSADVTDVSAFCQDRVMNLEGRTDNKYNVLISNNNVEVNMNNYEKRWNGPYMDSDPSDFMYDSWGNPIWYIRYYKNLYLWSAGADGEFYKEGKFYNADCAFRQQSNEENELCDDILISVYRFKKAAPEDKSMEQTPPPKIHL